MTESTKRALIIGASRGLGLGLVKEFVSRGWQVTATARDLSRATSLNEFAKAEPSAVVLEAVDIDDGEQVSTLARRLDTQLFDLVFISAGVGGPDHQSVDRVTAEELGRLFYTNAVAPIRLAGQFASRVKDGMGVLAIMSSRAGSVAEDSSGRRVLYRASKAALNSLTRSFVAGIKGRPITVLSMHPGWVRTDMGGAEAPLDVATSVAGIADVIEKRAGTKIHAFVDYQGAELPW